MKNEDENKERFVSELKELRERIAELEKSEIEQKRLEERIANLSSLKEELIGTRSLTEKLNIITDGIIDIFNAEFARIWMIKEGDLCEKGCIHAKTSESVHLCLNKTFCLHLMASSGLYTHIDGEHSRVPLGCYKIGRVASQDYPKFITNDVKNDPQVHDKEWAKKLGLVSFAGYRLISLDENPIGVMALFSKHSINQEDDKLLEDLANTTSHVIMAGQAEKALSVSEKRYKALYRDNPSMFFTLDSEGNVVSVNQFGASQLGYTVADLEGQSVLKVFHEDDRFAVTQQLKNCLQNPGKVYQWQFRKVRKDGSMLWVEEYARAVTGPEGVLNVLVVCQDISERKNTEKELEEAHQQLLNIIDFLPDATFVIDQDKKVIAWNRATEEMTGTHKEDIIGQGDYAYAIPWYGKRRPILIDLIGEKNSKYLSKYKNVHMNGNTLYAEVFVPSVYNGRGAELWVTASPLLDDKGKQVGAIESVRDISNRKNMEKALIDNERRLKDVINGSSIPQFFIDHNHKVIYWNKALEECSGVMAKEVIGTDHHWKAFYSEKRPCMADLLVDGDIEGISRWYEGKYKKFELVEGAYEAVDFLPKMGDKGKWLYFTVAAIKDIDGNIIGALETLEDITDRKQAEDALQKREKLLSLVTDNMLNVVGQIDKEGILQYISPSIKNVLGYEAGGFVDENIFQLLGYVHPEELEEITSFFLEANVSYLPKRAQFRIKRADGHYIWIESLGNPLFNDKNEYNGVVFTIIDIDKLKSAEQEIKASLEDKEMLLREIHHRVKNNMQIISSLLNLQSKYVKDKEAIDLCRDSQARVKSMAMIHEKLYQSKDLGGIDLAEYIKVLAVSLLNTYAAEPKLINMIIDVDDVLIDIDTAIPCGLIINELVTNSIKHAFLNGRKGEIKIEFHIENEGSILTVSDNGVGFPEDLNFKETRTLGLRLVNILVSQLNAKIDLDSSHGTEFKITFKKLKYKLA